MIRFVLLVAGAALVAALIYALSWLVALVPLYMAFRLVAGDSMRLRRSRRHRSELAILAGGLAAAAGWLRFQHQRRQGFVEAPISGDPDYLRGIEAGMRSARRKAGFEDGRLSESTRLLERPTP